jgi:hypothetical protein
VADQITAAIAATQQKAEARFGGQMALSTGRVIAINLPADLSDAEFLEAIVILIAQVRTTVRKSQAGPLSRIVVPAGFRVQ